MATIHVSNVPKAVAVALDWHLLPGTTSERREIDAITKQAKVKIGCVVSDNATGVTVLGLAEERSPGTNCGAAWLAKASAGESIVLVEPLEDGRLWLCAVKMGLPVQHFDILIDAAQLHQKLPELLRDNPDARICSTLENLDADYESVSPQSFAELVANTKPEKLIRVSGVSPVFMASTSVAVVALAAYFGGGAYLQKIKQEEARAKLAEMAAAQKQREAADQRRAQAQRLADGEKLLRSVVLDQPAMERSIESIFSAVEQLPLALAGWTLTGFDCTNRICSIAWTRTKTGTVVGFLTAAEEQGWQVSKAEGTDAMTAIELDASPRGVTLDVLEEAAPFRAALETQLQTAQLAGMKYELAALTPLEKSMPAPAPMKGKAPVAVTQPLPWHVGTATLKGDKLFEAKATPALLQHPALALSYLKADLKTKEWTLEVNYATR